MAVWGTPVTHEDDAERAVRAAVDLLDAVGGLRTPDGSTIAARCAVVTGEAAVTLGADGQGMVAGDLVNTASRLQSVAPPGTVLVGEATVRASESAIAYEPVGDQMLRGKQLPVPAWRAVRVVAGRGGYGRSTSAGGALRRPRRRAAAAQGAAPRHGARAPRRDWCRSWASRASARAGLPGSSRSTSMAWSRPSTGTRVARLPTARVSPSGHWAEMVRGRARIAESDPPDVARAKLAEMAAEYLADPVERCPGRATAGRAAGAGWHPRSPARRSSPPPGARCSSGSPTGAPRCWCSRTSTGRTRGCWTSSRAS